MMMPTQKWVRLFLMGTIFGTIILRNSTTRKGQSGVRFKKYNEDKVINNHWYDWYYYLHMRYARKATTNVHIDPHIYVQNRANRTNRTNIGFFSFDCQNNDAPLSKIGTILKTHCATGKIIVPILHGGL